MKFYGLYHRNHEGNKLLRLSYDLSPLEAEAVQGGGFVREISIGEYIDGLETLDDTKDNVNILLAQIMHELEKELDKAKKQREIVRAKMGINKSYDDGYGDGMNTMKRMVLTVFREHRKESASEIERYIKENL